MKLKAMLKFCKAEKHIEVIYYGNHKYVSSGNVMMCTDKVAPDWFSHDFATMLEIDKETLNNFYSEDHMGKCELLKVENLTKIGRLDFSVSSADRVLVPFTMPTGDVFFVENDKLSVFDDSGIRQYYYGKWNGVPSVYIAVDTMVIGAIVCTKVNLLVMKNVTEMLFKGITKSAAIGFLDAGGQVFIDDM